MIGLLTNECQIIRRNTAGTAVDAYGNVTPTTSGTVTVACSLQQNRRDEPGDEGELSVTTWSLFLPTGTGIDTSDLVSVDGTAYEVVGDPWDATEGSPDVWHVEASVKRAA